MSLIDWVDDQQKDVVARARENLSGETCSKCQEALQPWDEKLHPVSVDVAYVDGYQGPWWQFQAEMVCAGCEHKGAYLISSEGTVICWDKMGS